MRNEFLFNNDWLFTDQKLPLDAPDDAFEPVTLPHTNRVFPHHNFDNLEYQFISTYRKRFTLPESPEGRRVYLVFDGAMLVSTVYLNNKQLGVNAGGYTPFQFDITDYLNEDGENVLTVQLDSTERPDIPPFGYVVDYLTFGGIYRDVHLRMIEPIYVHDVFVWAENVLTDRPEVAFKITLTNKSSKTAFGKWSIGFGPFHGKTLINQQGEVELGPNQQKVVEGRVSAEALPRWSLDNPQLCQYIATFTPQGTHEPLDYVHDSFGIRHIEFDKERGFSLNGEHIKLMGLNRHQTYPYIGAAAPARLQRHDADLIKYTLGCNIVRTSHYPQSPHFLQRCDEIGLLVFEEIPGWQHIGDEDWQAISLRDVQVMIERDRNHPSIIFWGVRINESQDDDNFYRRTNALAHQLDHTRPTTGVRFFQESSFLEDIFGYNDFSNTVVEPLNLPHLVTEFNGHMFPTKTFDGEERKIEHARRHAFIQNRQMGMSNVLGAIGWCAFDYNTHKEFGSGDRICYHGVMDIFRLPKWAAYVYASQQDPKDQIVLQAATHWTMGDRSEGGNDPITVYSNVDEIDVWFGDDFLGRFSPDRETYPHLPHPPFKVVGLGMLMMWGQSFGTLRIVGHINGEQVVEQKISSDGIPRRLELEAVFNELHADGADMTPIIVKITDEFGNVQPYTNQVITFSVEGPATLIGENPFALPGGQGAVYLKASHTKGVVTVTAQTPRLEKAEVNITIG